MTIKKKGSKKNRARTWNGRLPPEGSDGRQIRAASLTPARLGKDLEGLAQRCLLAFEADPGKRDLRDLANVLHMTWQAWLRRGPLFSKLASTAVAQRKWPPLSSRQFEIELLRATVAKSLEQDDAGKLALVIITRMRDSPHLRVDCAGVPASTATWAAGQRGRAHSAVTRAVIGALDRGGRDLEEIVVKAALRALGYPTIKAANLFASRDMRTKPRKKTEK